jgi:two-component system, chemotaxis family, protein-glutamate methylesterase/glutaminase
VSTPKPVRVLIADDSAFMRRLLTDALAQQHGFDVVGSANDGDQALKACQELRPEVLTLDLTMPGLEGIGVLRGLQRTDLPVSVVVVSAFSPATGAYAVDALAEARCSTRSAGYWHEPASGSVNSGGACVSDG